MFTTPRLTTAATRRSLDYNRASSIQCTTNQENNHESSSQNNEEVLTMLRSLQQQVSTLQAQQNRAVPERSPTSTPNSSLNDKRKLPKEVTVRLHMFYKLLLHILIGPSSPNCQAITR